jgi:pilus assembly protein CpaC
MRIRPGLFIVRTLLASCIGATTVATAAQPQPSTDEIVYAGRNTSIVVPVYKSRVVELPAPAKRVSIGNPDIADVLILKSNELYILAKDLGSTNVLLWDENDRLVSSIAVSVTHDISALKAQLALVLPGENIEVTSAHRNIVLSGVVSSPVKMDAAIQIAKGYLEQTATAKDKIMFQQQQGTAGGVVEDPTRTGQVVNLLSVSGAQQVMLQVRVAEVQRDTLKTLDAQYNGMINKGRWSAGGVNGGATFPPVNWYPQNVPVPLLGQPPIGANRPSTGGNPVGPDQAVLTPTIPSIGNAGIFASLLSNSYVANLVLDAATQRGLAKILAEPTVTTLSGQEAQFLSGGSFPIPVPEYNGAIGVEFKDFGVKLLFQPLVLDTNRINLKLNISVSELTSTNSLVLTPISSNTVFAVPALTERRAVSTVELSDGQTIGIAGLMNESMRNAINKFPGLGDIPILGALFRSQNFQKGVTELVILVTPHLAKPLTASDMHLPTDKVVEPSNLDFFILGRSEGKPPTTEKPSAPAKPDAQEPTQP